MSYRAMDAAWWAADGVLTRWGPTWEGYAIAQLYTGTVAAGWLRLGLTPGTDINGTTTFFQAPFSVGGVGVEQQSEDNYDTGFFYIQEVVT